MNRRRALTIVAAVLLTLFGTVVLVAYVNSAERRAREGTEVVRVLVANDTIPPNTPAADMTELVDVAEIPADFRQADAVARLDDLGDQVTTTTILPRQQIVQAQFGEPGQGGQGGGQRVEEGKEIVALTLEPQRAVGGRLAPGDMVSVLISMDQAEAPNEADPEETVPVDASTGLVLNEVPVRAVTGGVTEESGEAAAAVTVSLEVDGSDAERIVFGAEHGRIWLTLNGESVPPPDIQTRTRENVYEGIGSGGR